MTVTEVIMREAKGKKLNTPWRFTTHAIVTECGVVPAGALYKTFESKDHGWLVFGPDTETTDGCVINRRIFKY